MAKIELSLESNINLIEARGMFGYKLSNGEVDSLIHRVSKNFHNHYCVDLSTTAVSLWTELGDRKHVHQIFLTAYDIEMEWRAKNQLRALLKVIANPYAFEVVSLTQLQSLPVPSEIELKDSLDVLTEEEFRNTPYWKCINTAALQLYGFECQVRINGIQCGSSKDIEAEYLDTTCSRGLLHRTYRSSLTAICRDCRIRNNYSAVGKSGALARKLYVKETK